MKCICQNNYQSVLYYFRHLVIQFLYHSMHLIGMQNENHINDRSTFVNVETQTMNKKRKKKILIRIPKIDNNSSLNQNHERQAPTPRPSESDAFHFRIHTILACPAESYWLFSPRCLNCPGSDA